MTDDDLRKWAQQTVNFGSMPDCNIAYQVLRLINHNSQLREAIRYLRQKVDGYDETFEVACAKAGIDANLL